MLLSQGKPSRNFTLIELLVVIAIMGLLISILLPSLLKSRHLSYQAICMSNQKQLCTATFAYSGENNSALMPCRPNKRYEEERYTLGSPLMNYFLRDTDGNMPATNHGMLYRDGYIGSGQVFYCPGYRATGDKYRSDYYYYKTRSTGVYPSPEVFQANSGSPGKVRGSYYFNPYGETKTYRNILEYDSSLIMFTDLLYNNTLSHGTVGKKWVIVRGDGAAKAVTSESTYSIVFSQSVGSNWGAYNTALDELTEALQ